VGEAQNDDLKLHFDSHLRLQFKGAKVTTDAGPKGESRSHATIAAWIGANGEMSVHTCREIFRIGYSKDL
jgi:hypothetical protein